jgi:hypothetical protein
VGLEHYFAMFRRLGYFDQWDNVMADRAEMSLLKPAWMLVLTDWLRAGLRSNLFPRTPFENQLAVSARVKTAVQRMGISLSQTDGAELLADSDVCFLEDPVRLPEARRRAMATSSSEGLVSVAAIRQWPYHASSRQLLNAQALGQPGNRIKVFLTQPLRRMEKVQPGGFVQHAQRFLVSLPE